jgi:hypothetical protein
MPTGMTCSRQEARGDITYANMCMAQYGPCTRSILDLVTAAQDAINPGLLEDTEQDLKSAAHTAAVTLADNPWSCAMAVKGQPMLSSSSASTVLFVRRATHVLNDQDEQVPAGFGVGRVYFPTSFLRDLVNEYRRNATNSQRLQFRYLMSYHSLKRTATGHLFELQTHIRLCTSRQSLLLRDSKCNTHTIYSQETLKSGTIATIKHTPEAESYYYVPTSSAFPGWDSLLSTGQGDLYVIQATIAKDHVSPGKGLEKLWDNVPKALRKWQWHFVIVTDTDERLQGLLKHFSAPDRVISPNSRVQLPRRKGIKVWGCAF